MRRTVPIVCEAGILLLMDRQHALSVLVASMATQKAPVAKATGARTARLVGFKIAMGDLSASSVLLAQSEMVLIQPM